MLIILAMSLENDMIDKKLEIIVPYRNRLEELNQFVPGVSKFLSHYCIDFHITIVNQLLEAQFNRGKLLNVGFLESCDKSDYSVFHDVDVFPIIYDGPPVRGNQTVSTDGVSVEWHGTPNYEYHDGAWSILNPGKRSAGTICKIDNDVYKGVNGHSNIFWGWVYEDNDMFYRLDTYLSKNNKPRFLKQGKRPSAYHSAHFKELRGNSGFKEHPEHIINEKISASVWKDSDYFMKDGLSSCSYSVDSICEYDTPYPFRLLNVYL